MTASVAGGRADVAVRASMAAVVVGVAMVAGWVSYRHAYDVVRAHGEDLVTARAVPLTVDGLVFASSMVLLHCARYGLPVPRLARFLLGLGVVATMCANVLHGAGHGPVGAVVAAWPAVSLIGSYELLMWVIRASGRTQHTDAPTAVSAAPVEPYASAVQMPTAGVLTGDREKGDVIDHMSRMAHLVERVDVDEHDEWMPATLPTRPAAASASRRPATVTAVVPAPTTEPATAPVSDRPASRRPSATPVTGQAATVAAWLADDPAMSGAAIAARLGVSERTGRRLRAAATSSQ